MILGATSWQVPGTYLDNVRLLVEHAAFSELLVYTWNDELQSMLEREWDEHGWTAGIVHPSACRQPGACR